MGQKKPISVVAKMLSTFNATATESNVTGTSAPCPEDGYYDIECAFTEFSIAGTTGYEGIGIDNLLQEDTLKRRENASGGNQFVPRSISYSAYLKSDQVVTLRVQESVGNLQIYVGSDSVNYLKITKRGT